MEAMALTQNLIQADIIRVVVILICNSVPIPANTHQVGPWSAAARKQT